MKNYSLSFVSYPFMRIFLKDRAAELVITFLSFAIALICFTLVTDDYGAFSYFNLPEGQFSNYPHIDYYYNGLIGLSKVYKWLYIHFPRFNWIGISFMGFAFLSLYLLLRNIKNMLMPYVQSIGLITAVQLLFALFFTENIISISHTRFSLLFCGLGLFNLAFTKHINPKGIFLNTALFVLGILIRPESGLGMILLVSIGYLIYSFNVKHLFKRTFFPVIITGSLFTLFAIDWANTDMYVKKVEPEIEYKIMDRRIVPLSSMKSAEDSIKYEAAMVGLQFDIHTMTPGFIRSLLLPGINLSPEHAAKVFWHTLSFYKHYLFIPCFIFTLLVFCSLQTGSRKTLFKIILFQIAVFMVMYLVDFNGRLIGERHFLSLQLISLLITTLYLFTTLNFFNLLTRHKILSIAGLLFLFWGTSRTILNYKANNDKIASDTNCYETAMQEMENTYSHRLIVSTLSNIYLLNRNFSILNKPYTKNTYIMFDVFTYSLSPDYMNYLGGECGCNPAEPVAFFKWLSDQNALYIAEPARYDLTERYMQIIHHQKIKFSASENLSRPFCIQATEMKDYEMRKVVAEN